jgi:hypothetical protein
MSSPISRPPSRVHNKNLTFECRSYLPLLGMMPAMVEMVS